MSNVTATTHEIPAPPEPGAAETVDELLAGLPAPPQARRRVLTVLLSAISVASLFLAVQFKDDAVYAMASSTPVELGEGLTANPASVGANRYVTLRARPSMAGAVTYSRWMFPGQHLVFPVAGREGAAPLYVQVSQENADAMTRGEFQGRLVPFRAAGGRYAQVGRYLHNTFDRQVDGDTWLLVDGATPRSTAWGPLVASLLVALALSDLLLLARLLRPSKD